MKFVFFIEKRKKSTLIGNPIELRCKNIHPGLAWEKMKENILSSFIENWVKNETA